MGSTIVLAVTLMMLVFAGTWAVSLRIRNYALLDVAFSYGLVLLVPLYLQQGGMAGMRAIAFSVVALVWSVRLGTYILARVIRHHPEEDVRYQKLRERWTGPLMFLLFFEMQALLVVLFSLPVFLAVYDPAPGIRMGEIVGLSITLLGILGETVADLQMAAFKKTVANRVEVCQRGLWRFSRHPNYFFESLVGVGFFVASLSLPYGWLTAICPLLMIYFLFQVTGIPLTEEFAVRSKGDAYRAYQRTTSVFVPWFRKSG